MTSPLNTAPRICVAGPLVLALVMGPLEHEPRLGEEQIAPASSFSPGGSANRAVALARLGLNTQFLCSIGIDEAGAIVRSMLTTSRVDLSHALRVPHQAITVSLGFDGDRALTTSGDLTVPSLSTLRQAPHALVAELHVLGANSETVEKWRSNPVPPVTMLEAPPAAPIPPTWVLSECRWDSTGQWKSSDLDALDNVDVFTLNEREAMNYTHKENARQAARQLAWHVPGVIVTQGAQGATAIIEGEEFSLPAAPAKTIDTTSAGHAFSAALVWARMQGLSPEAAVSMALLASARSTETMGSFTDAPTLDGLKKWTESCDVPDEYDLAFMDFDDFTLEEETTQRPDPAEPDTDLRDDSGFELAKGIADILAQE